MRSEEESVLEGWLRGRRWNGGRRGNDGDVFGGRGRRCVEVNYKRRKGRRDE